MFGKAVSPALTERLGSRCSHAILALVITSVFSGSAAAQNGSNDEDKTVNVMMDRLYECGSLYAIEKKCYALEKSDIGERSSVAASARLDRTIHFIYVFGKRSALSEVGLLAKMQLSVEKNMADIGNDCKNISTIQSKMSLQCDQTLRNLKEDRYQKIND